MAEEQGRRLERFLDGVPEDRREFIKRVAKTTAFVAPVVASFAMDGLTGKAALAQAACGNSTTGDQGSDSD